MNLYGVGRQPWKAVVSTGSQLVSRYCQDPMNPSRITVVEISELLIENIYQQPASTMKDRIGSLKKVY